MDISQIRQKIYRLQRERQKIETRLMRIPVMTKGSLSHVYNVCGTPTCKCKKGERHGPYPLLSFKIGDKKTTRFIKKEDAKRIEKEVRSYRTFQAGLTRLQQISEAIKNYFHQIREEQTRDAGGV